MGENMEDNRLLKVCAYCERDAVEVVAEIAAARLAPLQDEERAALEQHALVYVRVGNNRVLLCPDDRLFPEGHILAGSPRPTLTEEQQWELLNAPIELPEGITSLMHHCPMMEYDGFDKDEASFEVTLEVHDDHPGFLVGHCSECGMTVRSPVVQSNHREAAGE